MTPGRHYIGLIAAGAGHDTDPRCATCGQPWPCEQARAVDAAMAAIRAELERAMALHAPMKSDREGFDVIHEEFYELKMAVWFGIDQRGRPADPHDEATQLGAMAARFLLDVPRRP